MERWRISHKTADYTVIDNGIFRDEELSFEEIGLLCAILSLPEGWYFNVKGLVAKRPEGRDKVYSIIQRLIEHGYCVRTQNRASKTGRFISYDYTFFEVKNGLGCASAPQTGLPDTDSPDTALPLPANPTHIKYYKNKVNNDKVNKKREGSDFVPPTLDQVKQMVHDYRLSHTDPTLFWIHFSERDWKYKDGKPMKSLKRALYSWEKREQQFKSR